MRDIIYYYLVLIVIIYFLTGCSSPTESNPVSPPYNYGSADISTNTDSALIAIKIGSLTLKNRVGDGTIDSLLEGNYLLVVAKNGYRSDSSVIQISKGNRMVKYVLLNGDPNFDGSVQVATNITGSQNMSLKRRNITYYLLLEGSPKTGTTSDENDLIIEAPGYVTDSSKIRIFPKGTYFSSKNCQTCS